LDLGALLNDPSFWGLIASAALAVLLASFIQWLQGKRAESRKRKQMATVLGYEIASINLLAGQSATLNQASLDAFRKALTQGTVIHLKSRDIDLPRSIYDKPWTDLALFEASLAATISELYRWMAFANKVKQDISAVSDELKDAERDGSRVDAEFGLADFLSAMEGYIACQHRIVSLSSKALTGIESITPIDRSKVLGEEHPLVSNSPQGEAPK